MPVNVSLFAAATATVPQLRIGLSWSALCELVGPPQSRLAKEDAPLYSPAEWLPGKTRGKEGIAALHFGVLDLDHWKPDEVVTLVEDLARRRVAYHLASTWSNGEKGEDDICARLLVPFSRPALVSEWPRLWRALNDDITKGRADTHCKDASRSYFFPSFCEGRATGPFHASALAGDVIDVDALLARNGGPVIGNAPVESVGAELSRESVRALAKTLATSKNGHKQLVGRALFAILRSEPYAREPGSLGTLFEGGGILPEGRNDTTFKVVAKLCEHFPHADPESILELFRASIKTQGGPEESEIGSMIERQQAGARQALSQIIYEAIGRHEPYTDTELQVLADRAEIPLSTLRRRWIVQRDRTYYILRPEGYRAYTEAEAENAGRVMLAPAVRGGVDTTKVTQSGLRQKSPKELVADYGVIAKATVVDLTAQFARFDEDEQILIEAPCPIRVRAVEHKDVETWLRLLAGPKYERLCQWLAVLPALSEPCAALYLEGEPGVGKSLLAYGIARMWSDQGPTMMSEAMGTFNDALSRCPLVFADETSPVDSRGRVRTDELREFIQARRRPLKRKYRDNSTIVGATRVILAANNRNLIQTTENLTEEDIAAFVERIFYIRAGTEARRYLQQLEKGTVERWVDGNAIAEHAMHLAQTIKVPRTSRFLVAGEASDLTNSLTVGTGLRSSVAQWLVGYLLNPERLARCAKQNIVAPLVRVSRGRLLVSSRAIVETWGEYVSQDYEPPKPMEVSRALAGLSQEITLRIGEKSQKFRNVHLELLAEWAEQTGYATKGNLLEAMLKIENGIATIPSGTTGAN